jgi:hypothetical protein
MSRRHGAIAGLAVGLSMALAANLTYAVPRGPVVVGLGVACPLVLPLTLYLRTIFTVTRWYERVARELAMLAVTGPAVAISYVHTYSLVLAAEPSWPLLALIAPLSSDGVAGMSTMALHWAHRAPTSTRSRRPARPPAPARPVPRPGPVPVPTLVDRRADRDVRVEWLAARPVEPFAKEIAAVREQFQVSESTAKRIRRAARPAGRESA